MHIPIYLYKQGGNGGGSKNHYKEIESSMDLQLDECFSPRLHFNSTSNVVFSLDYLCLFHLHAITHFSFNFLANLQMHHQ